MFFSTYLFWFCFFFFELERKEIVAFSTLVLQTTYSLIIFSFQFSMCLIYFCIITLKLLLSVFGHTIMCHSLFDLFKYFIYRTFVIQICVHTPLFFSDVLKCLSHYKSNWKFSPLLFVNWDKVWNKTRFQAEDMNVEYILYWWQCQKEPNTRPGFVSIINWVSAREKYVTDVKLNEVCF